MHDLTEISGGWGTAVYSVDLTYQSEGNTVAQELIVKIHPGLPEAVREFDVLQAVSALGIPVPAARFHTEAAPGLGGSSVVMERVAGSDLRLALSRSLDLIPEMARHLAALHQIPTQSVFPESEDSFAEDGFVAPVPEVMRATLRRFELTDFHPLSDWLDGTPPSSVGSSVLHNDYHPGNILVSEDSDDLVILDWSHAGIGDHRTDLAWSAFWTGEMSGERARSGFVEAYEKISERPVNDLEYFEALKLGARLLTVATWLQGSVKPPVPKITRETIRGDYRPTVLAVYERVREITGVRIPMIQHL